jgi:hypothetical protein
LSIITICTDPRFVETSDTQQSAIGKRKSFSCIIDPEAHTFFNSDRSVAFGLIGDDYFSDHAIELGARLHWLRQSVERDNDYRALTRSSYPITDT